MLDVALPARVLADAEEASNAITRFDAELGAEIAPFASVLLRSESAASSNIENPTASARAITGAEALGDTSRRNATLIVNNTEAMKATISLADRLDEDAILAMHAALMRDTNPDPAGHWRTEQAGSVAETSVRAEPSSSHPNTPGFAVRSPTYSTSHDEATCPPSPR